MTFPVDAQKYLLFLGVDAALAWAPGPANLFAVGTGMQKGGRAAFVGALGLNSATACWFALAVLGLGALVATFPTVFRALAIIGAGYIAWIGLSSIRSALSSSAAGLVGVRALRGGPFWSGFAVQISNPKALVFFTAVLPPFLDLRRALVGQWGVFAATVILMDLASQCAYGFGGAAFAARMEGPHFRRWFAFGAGVILILAAGLIGLHAYGHA